MGKIQIYVFNLPSQGLHYQNEDNPSKTNKMMRILMFVRILSLIRLARVSRLVRFFNEVEKVKFTTKLASEIPSGLHPRPLIPLPTPGSGDKSDFDQCHW